MSSEWIKSSLGAVSDWKSGGTPKKDEPTYWGGDIPWISANSMHSTTISESDLCLTAEGLVNGSRIAAEGSVLLLVRGGALHNRIPVGIATRNVAFNQDVKALTAKTGLVKPWYLLFWLMGMERFLLDSVVEYTGIGAGKLDTKRMLRLELLLPSLNEQDEIIAVIKSLDDRITLLRETNATLEGIAQALFKSWFVDFDPVRAKMEGRAPEGMDEATAALFPDGLEDSALGLVPKGWFVRTVSSVADVVKGKSYSSKDLVSAHDTALVTLKSFARGGGFRLDGFKPYSGPYKPTQVVVPGDLIVAYTDVTQAAELIGKPAIVVGVNEHKTLVASLDVGIIRPVDTWVSRQFLYGLFKTDAFQAHTFSHTSGTTVLHLSKDGVGSYQFVCPPIAVISAFSAVAESLAGRRQVNIDQMRTLAALRDALLPRLISGQLRLPDVTKEIEGAIA